MAYALCLGTAPAKAQEDLNHSTPVVVELFTSQGCPACPPADQYLGKLAQSRATIALSCHVDYFNVRGDTLARPFCTERQTRYIKQIGRKAHFTPQMMINGHMSAIGYDTTDVAAKMVKGRAEKLTPILIRPVTNQVFNYTIHERNYYDQATVSLILYKKPLRISHRGHSAIYHQVIDKIIPLGTWGGTEITRPFTPLSGQNHAGFAIIAQDIKTGKILAAGNYKTPQTERD